MLGLEFNELCTSVDCNIDFPEPARLYPGLTGDTPNALV